MSQPKHDAPNHGAERAEGYAACRLGRPLDANPYWKEARERLNPGVLLDQGTAWQSGWLQAQAESS